MYYSTVLLPLLLLIPQVHTKSFHDNPEQDQPHDRPDSSGHDDRRLEDLNEKWGFEWGFQGISTFAHLRHVRCLTEPWQPFDIAILGCPFDTGTTYRPGARFGPRAIRAASSRQSQGRGYNHRAHLNPYTTPLTIIDCGDIPVTPLDNALAIRQMSEAYLELGGRKTASRIGGGGGGGEGTKEKRKINRGLGDQHTIKGEATESEEDENPWPHPRILTLGGDHTLSLPTLRALTKLNHNQPITVLHFDAHLDTWHPSKYPGQSWLSNPPSHRGHNHHHGNSSSSSSASAADDVSKIQSSYNHGSMFHLANLEGLINRNTSVHAGLRTRLTGIDEDDYAHDTDTGFLRIESDEIDNPRLLGQPSGAEYIIDKILNRIPVGVPVYLSIDIDVLDPGLAPGTGTPEPGGWTTREMIRILRGLEGLNVVGADLVEVAPMYDGGSGEGTALAASQLVFEVLTSMVKVVLKDRDIGVGMGRGGKGGERKGKDEL